MAKVLSVRVLGQRKASACRDECIGMYLQSHWALPYSDVTNVIKRFFKKKSPTSFTSESHESQLVVTVRCRVQDYRGPASSTPHEERLPVYYFYTTTSRLKS